MDETLSFNGNMSGNGVMQFGSDEAFHFEWEVASERLGHESEKQGREIFRNIDRCTILYPGFKNTLCKDFGPEAHDQTALRQFLNAHPKAAALYSSWKMTGQQQWQGTPIDEWSAISVAEKAELKALQLHTVEQVAAASDLVCQQMGMKGREYRTKAIAFIETAKETAAAQKFAAENERLREEMSLMKAQIAQLGKHVTSSTDQPRRGRPRKIITPTDYGVVENESNS